MIEVHILNYLKSKGFNAFTEHPQSETEYILIQRTGETWAEHLNSANIALQCYSTTKYKTAQLYETIREIMRDFPELDEICSCKQIGGGDFPDVTQKKHRYQLILQIIYY